MNSAKDTHNSYPYQFKPFIGSSHAWALAKLQHIKTDACILDIGPGTGDIVRALSQQGLKNFYAVEVDHDNIKQLSAQNLYTNITNDLCEYTDKLFDCILLLDVLEHMEQPFKFLEQVVKQLKSGGLVLISIPNIAHWSIRLSLLFGFFEYTDRGIIDRTHLQFFNRRRFKQLISLPELDAIDLSASIEPLEFVFPSYLTNNQFYRKLRTVQTQVAHSLPGFFGYQHLALLRKI